MRFTGMEVGDIILIKDKLYQVAGQDENDIKRIGMRDLFKFVYLRGPLIVHFNTPTEVLQCYKPGFNLIIGGRVYSWTEDGLVERQDKDKFKELRYNMNMPAFATPATAFFGCENDFVIGGVYYKLLYAEAYEVKRYILKVPYNRMTESQINSTASMEIYLEREFMKLERKMKYDI